MCGNFKRTFRSMVIAIVTYSPELNRNGKTSKEYQMNCSMTIYLENEKLNNKAFDQTNL